MENRDRILECALGLFSARGYDAVGIQEVVDRSEVSKPTLYHYFSSKHGLLTALLDCNFRPWMEMFQAAADYQGDLIMTLRRTAEVSFRYAGEHPAFYRLQLAMQFAPPESEPYQAVRPFVLQQHRWMETAFALAVTQHGNMRGRQRIYAATWIGTINTYNALILGGYAVLEEQTIHTAVHQFMHGILS